MKGFKISEASFITEKDRELVTLCDKAGYKAIAVSCHDPEVTISDNWHNKHKVKFVAGEPDPESKLKGRNDSWPAIWKIVDILGGGAGCGNSHQKQLKQDHPYSECSYRKIDGEWYVFNAKVPMEKISSRYKL